MSDAETSASLATAARLFGRLLVRELDAQTLAELRQEPVRAALAALDVAVPGDDELDELGQRYFALFLHPDGGSPPIQSLWERGQYDADPAARVRRIAAAAGLQLAPSARGAAPDHLGCLLLLWAELREARPDFAAQIAAHHFAWADAALQHSCSDEGFYGAAARATVDLLRHVRATAEQNDSTTPRPQDRPLPS